jgi:plastocyanin
MRTITPTLVICTVAAAGTAVMLAAPSSRPDATPAPSVAPTPGAASGAAPVELVVDGFQFAAVTAPAGSPVTVVNRDGEAHTVTASDGSFDTFVAGGASVSFVAPAAPGTYSFVCDIHPSMSGRLVVT